MPNQGPRKEEPTAPNSSLDLEDQEAASKSPQDYEASLTHIEGKPWGLPFVRVDKAWTKFEVWLCTITVILEIFAMTLWVALKGMSTPPGAALAGTVFRGLMGAVLGGLIVYWALARQSYMVRRVLAVIGVIAGGLSARLWHGIGVDWSANLLNWFQQASTLTLVGGLRGLGTRLTVLLAMIGGSLATAAGRHVTIDLVTRYIRPAARLPLVVTGWIATSAICMGAAWGFFDHIAIENFGAPSHALASEKIKRVTHELGEHSFMLRKQLTLDVMTLPRVAKGEIYSNWLTGERWGRFLDEAGFVERYGKEPVDALRIPPDALRSPIIAIPGRGEPRGTLTEAANLAFPIGLFIIALRFLLLSLLAVSGHVSVDPETEPTTAPKGEALKGEA